MKIQLVYDIVGRWGQSPTILEQNVEALLHKKICVQDDEPEGEWKDIITGSFPKELPHSFLQRYDRQPRRSFK